MRRTFFIAGLLLLSTVCSSAQIAVLAGKIRTPTPTSFYSQQAYKHDAASQDLVRVRNTPNKLAENINNPSGTIVVDYDISVSDLKTLMANPEKIVIIEDDISIPIKIGKTVYHIPVNTAALDSRMPTEAVMTDVQEFIYDCMTREDVLPARLELRKKEGSATCELFAFSTKTGIFPFRRVNIGCALENFDVNVFYCYSE